MIKCSNTCIPCCDYCINCIHDNTPIDAVHMCTQPIGCKLHLDKEHQQKAQNCTYCDDFYCKNLLLKEIHDNA